MARITASIRDAIVANAVKAAGIPERDKAVCKMRGDFAEKIRVMALTQSGLTDEDIKKTVSKIEAAGKLLSSPEGHTFGHVSVDVDTSYFNANICGQKHRLYLSGTTNDRSKKEIFADSKAEYDRTKPVPHMYGDDFIVRDTALMDELVDIDAAAEALHRDNQRIKRSVLATVTQFTTVEKLVAAWPEAAGLLPPPEAVKTGTGVSIPVADLNAMIGLPVTK